MKTRQWITTISYNTPDFLCNVLKRLEKNKIIDFWAYIIHRPEDDEGGKKEHEHVFIIPNRDIDTVDLRKDFYETDKEVGIDRKCMPFRKLNEKKFGDWGLYVIHDPLYLSMKNQSRVYHYKESDIVSSDPDFLNALFREIDYTEIDRYVNMRMAVNAGASFSEYSASFHIPIQQLGGYKIAWESMQNETYRNGRNGHDLDYDIMCYESSSENRPEPWQHYMSVEFQQAKFEDDKKMKEQFLFLL